MLCKHCDGCKTCYGCIQHMKIVMGFRCDCMWRWCHATLHLWKQDFRFNSYSYVKLLETVVKSWMERVTAEDHICGNSFWFLALPLKRVSNGSQRISYFPSSNFWPLNLANCNPNRLLSMGCNLERYRPQYLQPDLVAKINDLLKDTVKDARTRFQSHLETMVEAEHDCFD